ncbi:NAD(P)-binding domain-containing protein [Streptomyces sp. NPDC002666]
MVEHDERRSLQQGRHRLLTPPRPRPARSPGGAARPSPGTPATEPGVPFRTLSFTRKIGILGTGDIDKTLTRRLSAAGHEVKAANPRGPATIAADGPASGGRAVPEMGAHDRLQRPGPDIADGSPTW